MPWQLQSHSLHGHWPDSQLPQLFKNVTSAHNLLPCICVPPGQNFGPMAPTKKKPSKTLIQSQSIQRAIQTEANGSRNAACFWCHCHICKLRRNIVRYTTSHACMNPQPAAFIATKYPLQITEDQNHLKSRKTTHFPTLEIPRSCRIDITKT